MSVVVTGLFRRQKLYPLSGEKMSFLPHSKIILALKATGDASGGGITLSFTIDDLNLYYILTDFLAWTSDTTISTVGLTAPYTDWQENEIDGVAQSQAFWHENLIANPGTGFKALAGNRRQPVYLGKAITNPASVGVDFLTNTNTKVYCARLIGYAYQYPPIPFKLPPI